MLLSVIITTPRYRLETNISIQKMKYWNIGILRCGYLYLNYYYFGLYEPVLIIWCFPSSCEWSCKYNTNINNISTLNGTNFKSCKENLLIVLGLMNLDLVLRDDFPPLFKYQNTFDEKKDKERWDRSNCLCLTIMKKTIG